MLSISLEPDQYFTINGDIVVKFSKVSRGRCFLAIKADRSIPIVRGEVLERNGEPAPDCIRNAPPRKRPRPKPDTLYRWNDDRERAVRSLEKVADRLERNGSGDEARVLRAQLAQLVPAAWEDEVK